MTHAIPGSQPVTAAQASFAVVGSIALHGVRQADVQPGAKVVVIGLGLIGQLTAQVLSASGCEVAGIDIAELPLQRLIDAGGTAFKEAGATTTHIPDRCGL